MGSRIFFGWLACITIAFVYVADGNPKTDYDPYLAASLVIAAIGGSRKATQ